MEKGKKKQIVILGVGFGGLRALLVLDKKLKRYRLYDTYELILIDRNDYHTYTPLLYEIATTDDETATALKLKEIATFPIQEILRHTQAQFIKDEVRKINLINGTLSCSAHDVSFDYLILALGSEPNYFGIAGIEKYAFALKTFSDAITIRNRIMEIFKTTPAPKIVVGGGGSTGIELAGEIKEAFPTAEAVIVDGAQTILPGFDPRIIVIAHRRLTQLKITVTLGSPIKTVKKSEIELQNREKIPFDLFVWAGGVKASHLLSGLPIKIRERGRAEVIDEMECLPATPNARLPGQVYAIGDIVCVYDPRTKRPMPGVARAAIVQANIVAENILQTILSHEGRARKMHLRAYMPAEYPYVIPIGGKHAVAKVGRFVVQGKIGWIFKLLVELNYLLSIMPTTHAFRVWFRGIKIFIKNDRLG